VRPATEPAPPPGPGDAPVRKTALIRIEVSLNR
jgi:hypothetical protein